MLHGRGHDAARIVATLPRFPAIDLFQRIGRRLARDGGVSAAAALALGAMTASAGDNAARLIADQPQGRRRTGQGRCWGVGRRHGGVIARDRPSSGLIQVFRHLRHDVVGTQAGGVILHLLLQIALIQPRQTRGSDAVALALQAVAGEAGVGCATRTATHGDDLTRGGEGAIRLARRGVARSQRQEDGKGEGQGAHSERTRADGSGSGICSGTAGAGADCTP